MTLIPPSTGGAPAAWRWRSALTAGMLAGLLSACGGGAKDAAPGAGAPRAMPPPEVGVLVVAPQSVALQSELPGRVSAVRVAQVRARVNGVVLKRLFREGSDVKAGEPLFQIDAASYQAALDSAQASWPRPRPIWPRPAPGRALQAPGGSQRGQPARIQQCGVAQKLAEADVAAPGRLQMARINLDYATVRAPISGRIGQSLVTEGALVSQARGHAAGADPADRHGVCELHPVQH
jgi:membrane fusion protein (multidrug efflux system)